MKKSLESKIAEQLLKIGVKNLSSADTRKLQERVRSIMEAGEPVTVDPVNFIFTFQLGKYKANEVSQADINKLAADLKPMINNIGAGTLINAKTTITLIGEADPTPISKTGTLYQAGITSNKMLAEARIASLERIIRAIIISQLPGATDALIDKAVVFSKSTKTGTTRNITANITQTGETSTETVFKCDFNSGELSGKQADASTSYVGYEVTHPITVPAGTEVSLHFDPYTIPDCFVLKYGDSWGTSGFYGVLEEPINGYYAEGEIPDWIREKNINFRQYARYVIFQENGGAVDKVIQQKIDQVKSGATNQVSGQDSELGWKFTFTTKAFENTVQLVVFSPLGHTKFKVAISCKLPDPNILKPLPVPQSFN
jgi:hypothetical protein